MLHNESYFTCAAKEVSLSGSTIIRIFDLVSYPKPAYALSNNEFKGNSGGEKYHCILTDPCRQDGA